MDVDEQKTIVKKQVRTGTKDIRVFLSIGHLFFFQ